MKRIIFVVALLISLATFALGQATNEQQNLKRIEEELNTSMLKGDASVFEKYLADAFISTDPGGGVTGKAESINLVKSRDLKFESSKLNDMKVQLYGNSAVVTYKSTAKGKFKDQDISGVYRWTDVFVKQDGRWKMVATQGTAIAQQKSK